MQSDAAGAVSPRAVVGEGPVRQKTDPALNGELVPSVGIDCKPQSGGLGQPARPEVNARFRLRVTTRRCHSADRCGFTVIRAD